MASELTSISGLIALGAVAVAVVSLVLTAVLFLKVGRLRRAQRAVLGGESRDLVTHAEGLQAGFDELRDWVERSMSRLDGRTGEVEERLERCVAYHAVIRYDAYGEMSGRQSSSVALLDSDRSGVVISSIHHREHARIYIKPVGRDGHESELSPEESEAIETALAGERV